MTELCVASTLEDLLTLKKQEWADVDSVKTSEVSKIIHMVGAGVINRDIHFKFLGTHKTRSNQELGAILLGAVLVHAKVHRKFLTKHEKGVKLWECNLILSKEMNPDVVALCFSMLQQFVNLNHQGSAPQIKTALAICHGLGLFADDSVHEFLKYFEAHDISVHFLPF